MRAQGAVVSSPSRPQVWLSPVAAAEGSRPAELPTEWLDDHERTRLGRFSHPLAARRFLLARTLLKQAVAALEAIPPADVILSYSPNGKPFLPGAGRPFISISHSANAVAVALADQPIGIDLESAQRTSRPWERPSLFLHPREVDKLAAEGDAEQRALQFTRRWSCQEAAIKLLDSSVFHANARVEFEQGLAAGICCERRVFFASWLVQGADQLVPLEAQRDLRPGLVMSLASNAPLAGAEFRSWSGPSHAR